MAEFHSKHFATPDDLDEALFHATKAHEYSQSAQDSADEAERQAQLAQDTANQIITEEAARQKAEAARVITENERAAAEGGRKNAESARVAEESRRADAEQARTQAETNRTNQETIRRDAETNRLNAEQARKNAEQRRVTAEDARRQTEAERQAQENARAGAEQQRQQAESSRINEEDIRLASERVRVTEENNRKNAESIRVTAENERKSKETTRQSEETKRIAAEQARAQAENSRVTNETARNQSEQTRQTQETARVNAENLRVTAETGRVNAEKARVSAETTRSQSEQTRKTQETARVNAEKARVTAETGRVNAEKARVSAETGRINAETSRITAETGRVNAEKARVSAETNRVAEHTALMDWGVYSATRAYVPGNKVVFDKQSYLCIASCTGISPKDGAHWRLIAGQGGKGDKGDTGLKGDKGDTGPQGPAGATPIINDLTTGGTNAALSAEQGKVLAKYRNGYNIFPKTSTASLEGAEAGSVLLDNITGNSVQDGTPTPDAPKEIQSVQGPLIVSSVGANLFDANTVMPVQGWTKQNDGSWFTATPGAMYQKKLWENTAQYSGQILISFYYKNTTTPAEGGRGAFPVITYTDGSKADTVSGIPASFSKVSLLSDAHKTVKYIYWSHGTTRDTWIKDIGIYIDSTVSNYIPYSGMKYTIPITASNTTTYPGQFALRKVGDIADTIELGADGRYKLMQRIGMKVLDGTEDYLNTSNPPPIGDNVIRVYLNIDNMRPYNESRLNSLVSSHFTQGRGRDEFNSIVPAINRGHGTFWFNLEKILVGWNEQVQPSVSAKAYFASQYAAGTPVVVNYLLITPNEIDLSDETQAALRSIAAQPGISNVYFSQYPAPKADIGIPHGVFPSDPYIAAKVTNAKRTARFTVGTSTAGWTKADCDFLCDGTADQVEINAAIQALPATGGEIVILDGTYNLTGNISVNKNYVTLQGNGQATLLKRMWNSTSSEGVVTVTASGCTVQKFKIDGDKSTYSSSNNHAILLFSCTKNVIADNVCINGNNGIFIYEVTDCVISGNINNGNNTGVYLYKSSGNTVIGNICNENGCGILIYGASSNNTIAGSTCNNNNIGIRLDNSSDNTITGNTCNKNKDNGIQLSSSNNNTVTGNTCNNNTCGFHISNNSSNTITGNTCNNNSSVGIGLYNSSNNTVIGNTCNNNSRVGMQLYNSSNNTITGNTCIRGTGLTSDYTSAQYTISLASAGDRNNLIAFNNIMGKNYTSDGGTGNTFAYNKYAADMELAKTVTATLTTSSWTGSSAPYTQVVSVAGVTATSINDILPALNITSSQLTALQAANIQDGGQAAGKITLKAFGTKPTVSIPIRVLIWGA